MSKSAYSSVFKINLAAGDLKDMDAILNRLDSKVVNPEILDAICTDLALMATEEFARPNNAANLNVTTPESPDAQGGST